MMRSWWSILCPPSAARFRVGELGCSHARALGQCLAGLGGAGARKGKLPGEAGGSGGCLFGTICSGTELAALATERGWIAPIRFSPPTRLLFDCFSEGDIYPSVDAMAFPPPPPLSASESLKFTSSITSVLIRDVCLRCLLFLRGLAPYHLQLPRSPSHT